MITCHSAGIWRTEWTGAVPVSKASRIPSPRRISSTRSSPAKNEMQKRASISSEHGTIPQGRDGLHRRTSSRAGSLMPLPATRRSSPARCPTPTLAILRRSTNTPTSGTIRYATRIRTGTVSRIFVSGRRLRLSQPSRRRRVRLRIGRRHRAKTRFVPPSLERGC